MSDSQEPMSAERLADIRKSNDIAIEYGVDEKGKQGNPDAFVGTLFTEDIPDLIDEVERCHAEIERLRAALQTAALQVTEAVNIANGNRTIGGSHLLDYDQPKEIVK